VALNVMSLSQQHMDLSCLLFSSFHYHKLINLCEFCMLQINVFNFQLYACISSAASPLLKAKAQCTRSGGTGAHSTTILPHKVSLLDVKASNGETGYGPVFYYTHNQFPAICRARTANALYCVAPVLLSPRLSD
jgi:hypothetical protein